LPSQALFQGDEDVATPFLFSNGDSVGMRPPFSAFAFLSAKKLAA